MGGMGGFKCPKCNNEVSTHAGLGRGEPTLEGCNVHIPTFEIKLDCIDKTEHNEIYVYLVIDKLSFRFSQSFTGSDRDKDSKDFKKELEYLLISTGAIKK